MRRSNFTLPPLTSLRAFEAVSRLGSVKLASEYLNVTPSAISHQIRALESHFSVRLFKASGRELQLTEEGAIYAPAVIRAFADLLRANELLAGAGTRPVIRVSATPTFALLAALPGLDAFKRSYPRFELRLEARLSQPHLDEKLYDAAVVIGRPPFAGLFAQRLFRSRIMPLAHPQLWARSGPVKTVEDLAGLPLIDYTGAPITWRSWLRKLGLPKSDDADEPYLISDSLLTAIQMAECAKGVILAPFPLLIPKVTAGLLCRPSLDFPCVIGDSDFYAIGRLETEHSPRMSALRKWLMTISAKLESESQAGGY